MHSVTLEIEIRYMGRGINDEKDSNSYRHSYQTTEAVLDLLVDASCTLDDLSLLLTSVSDNYSIRPQKCPQRAVSSIKGCKYMHKGLQGSSLRMESNRLVSESH